MTAVGDGMRCRSCGVRVYTLTPAPPPKFYVCGHCAKTLTTDGIIALAETDRHHNGGPTDQEGGPQS